MVLKRFSFLREQVQKFLPCVYEIPGEYVHFGEDIIAGLKREIKEEPGMDIAVGDPFASFTYINEVKGSHSVEVVYFAKFVSLLEDITLHPEDHSEFGWFATSDLDEVITENKRGDDPEIITLAKAFDLLNGGVLNLG
ncbi:MAG: ADP-ribose pyrophosphatase YjhB (NUDIX family) [Acidimicrobiales bacterium]|jgi:ADP-ribose pyrophosphatase YjhB (NUDIX family)